MYKYFVSYFTKCDYGFGFGFGNFQANMKNKIVTVDDLIELQKAIAKDNNISEENIIILNYILLNEEDK